MKKIGILGSGAVGKSLATGFLKHGYEVSIGTGNPDKLKDWQTENNTAIRLQSFQDCATWADIIVLAVKGSVALSLMKQLNKQSLHNKIVIDTTNPIADTPPVNGVLSFFTPKMIL